MSLFGDLDVASAQDNPFKVPDNTYVGYITEVFVKPTNDGSKRGLNLIYRVAEGEYAGRKVKEWKELPKPEDLISSDPEVRERANQNLSFIKGRMKDLGIPESSMNTMSAEDVKGKKISFQVVTNKAGYTNVTRVTLVDETAGEFKGFG